MAGGKQTPRQKMINLMYLVFIAMLAMNILARPMACCLPTSHPWKYCLPGRATALAASWSSTCLPACRNTMRSTCFATPTSSPSTPGSVCALLPACSSATTPANPAPDPFREDRPFREDPPFTEGVRMSRPLRLAG